MNPPVSGDESLPGASRATSPSTLHSNFVTPANTEATSFGEENLSRLNRLTFAGSIVLVTIAFSAGFIYMLEHRWAPAAHLQPSAANLALAPTAPIRVQAQMLQVTAIALGQIRSATVNGKRVAEGDSFDITTPEGPVSLTVSKIEDHLVRFAHGEQMIEASLSDAIVQKSP